MPVPRFVGLLVAVLALPACGASSSEGPIAAVSLDAAPAPGTTAAAAPPPIAPFSGCFEQRRTLPELSLSEGFMADVDGDGRGDVVALGTKVDGSGRESIFVLGGRPDGSFVVLDEQTVAPGWFGLVAGDFDEDGATDFVASDYEQGRLYVRLARGKARFERGTELEVGRKAGMLATADLNADGHLDLALAHARDVRLFMGDGRGAFRAGRRLTTGEYPSRPVLVDFDGDGTRDVLVASNDSHFLSVFLSRDGRLTTDARYPCGKGGAPLAVADFDGDGTLDVAMGAVNSRSTCVFRGEGGGRLALVAELDDGGWEAAAADLDGDGRAELLLARGARKSGFRVDWGVFSVYQLRAGTLERASHLRTAAPAEAMWASDLDGDGMSDIVLISQHGVAALIGRPCDRGERRTAP